MKRALVVHPQFTVPGGAELVSLQIIALLLSKLGTHVTVLTLEPCTVVDLERGCVGDSLDYNLLSFKVAPVPARP